MDSLPLTRDLVLIGGGHTHALVLRRWGMQPLAGVRLTLVNPGPVAAYSGMLPGFVAGHYGRDDLDIDLVALARFAGARLIVGAVTAIDRQSQTVTVPGRPPVGYDLLSLDIGVTSGLPDLPGFADYGVPAKPLAGFADRWARTGRQARNSAVIGGGVAGVELALAMAHAGQGHGAVVHLLTRGQVLGEVGRRARRLGLAALAASGVRVIAQAQISALTDSHIIVAGFGAGARPVRSDFTVIAAGARVQGWLGDTGLELSDGFVAVDGFLRSSDPAIFAVGDCAHMTHSPRPKSGVFAVRQAPVLFDNLRAALSGGALRRFRPQRHTLRLISLGSKAAIAERAGLAVAGPVVWRLKDRIDGAFMARLNTVPDMPGPDLPATHALGLREVLGDAPMCGGCGAKVGRGTLRHVLATLPAQANAHARADIALLPGDDAALLLTGSARQVISTDHLRGITTDPALLARICAVHALGDIWAMGAAPQAATVSLILPRMSPALQQRTLTEIMAVATGVMGQAGAAIVGGHTSMGAELSIGFTVTGLCDLPPLTLQGARPGDAIILTKPLGSGVILAGSMRRSGQDQARGADLFACYAAMVQPQGAASVILTGGGAHAMTDVTGFGLAGHLLGICEASGVGAAIALDRVPLLQGALELAAAGVRSTIWAENRAQAAFELPQGPRSDLLFDPQTAGGLLAAVDPDSADAVVQRLVTAGYPAVIIGWFETADPRLRAV